MFIKGPYTMRSTDHGYVIDAGNIYTLAFVPDIGKNTRDTARLLHAAPDLLHALTQLLEDDNIDARQAGYAAIEKARGE